MTLDVGSRPAPPSADPTGATLLADALLEAVRQHVGSDAAHAWAVQQAAVLQSLGTTTPAAAAPVAPVVRPLVLNEAHWEITSNGLALRITVTQYRLLGALLRAECRTVSTRDLALLMFGSAHREQERVAAHVRRLRRRLVEEEVAGCSLDTVRGVGYRLAWTT